MKKLPALLSLAAALGAVAAGAAAARPQATPRLVAADGPGFTITLKTAAGKPVRTLRAGTYTIAVHDRSAIHNFHLTGPGVDTETEESDVGSTTWRVRLRKGVYRFDCDPHVSSMHGSFRVT